MSQLTIKLKHVLRCKYVITRQMLEDAVKEIDELEKITNTKNWFVRNMIKARTVRKNLTQNEAEVLAERMNSRIDPQNKLKGTGEVCFVPDHD